MTYFVTLLARSVRYLGPIAVLLGLISGPLSAWSAVEDDHAEAAAALADVHAAVAAIVHADASYSTDPAMYHGTAQGALNAVVGAGDPGYAGDAPAVGADTTGAIGHIDHLLDRKATPLWVDALHGAEANLRAAAAQLATARRARELMEYQQQVTAALADLGLAEGRPDETGVLGGLEGAIANTTLGVPTGANVVDACTPPETAPAYGTHDGALAWIALPAGQGMHELASPIAVTKITIHGNLIVLHTAAAPAVSAACSARKHAGVSADPPPALYTKDQALAGEGVFMAHCAACHGANLHGVSAPAVAGTDFLQTAKNNGWTLKIIRYLVFNMMPLNAGGTLSNQEYAETMAFLLASNCYPPGKKPFPEEDQPAFAKIQLAPVTGSHTGEDTSGICQPG